MKILLFLFFSFIAFVYFHNATKDVYSGDIGDFVTAAYVFGIAHPPGYPLLTFLGFIFTHLPFPVPPVTKMAYVSVIASITGLIFFYKFSFGATKERLIAIFATGVLAFSYPFWIQTEIPEVFALSHSLLIIIFFFAIKFYEEKKIVYLYLTLFFMGLSLTNQHAIIAVFPAVGLLLLGGIRWDRAIRKITGMVVRGLGAFLLGLLPYIYVPIAASTNPAINWLGGEATVQKLIWLFMRQAYTKSYTEVFEFSESLVGFFPRLLGVKLYAQYFIDHYSIVVVVLSLIGILALLKNKKLLLLSLVGGFILSGPLFIFLIFPPLTDPEDLKVVEMVYTHSFIVLLLLLPFGLLFLLEAIGKLTRPVYVKLFLLPLFIIPFVLFLQNFPRTNLSATNIGNNLGRDILLDLPQGSAVFLKGDSAMFNTWYVYYVLGERKDIELVNPLTGVRNEFYYKELLTEYKKSEPKEKNPYPTKILPFLLVGADIKRPIFFNYNQKIASSDYVLVPHGLLLKLRLKSDLPSKEQFLKKIQSQLEKLHIPSRDRLGPAERNLLGPNITRFYSSAYSRIGNFINLIYNDPQASMHYYKKAIEIDKLDPFGYAGLGYAYSQTSKNCNNSQEMFEKAISLNPFYSAYHKQLYQVLIECEARDEEISAIKIRYNTLFKKEIDKEPFWKYQLFSDT